MQYMFSILTLGDPITAIQYMHKAKLNSIAQDKESSKWGVHLTHETDEAEIEIVIPVAIPNYDEIIPMSDGILYFLNPNSAPEVELFKELMHIIQKMRRDIPTVVIFRDRENLIQHHSNDLLGFIWETYPFEAFIADYDSKNQLNEILDTLSYTMMYGELLINFNTAWLQIPILLHKANEEIETQHWGNAARLTEKLSKINEKFGMMDEFVYAEQAAWLYAKNHEYLKASAVIKKFNDVFAERYRRIYVDYLVDEGRKLNNQKKFAEAGQTYEKAGNWAKIELADIQLMQKVFKFAVYSWISALEIQNAFSLLDQFEHDQMIKTLEDITQKVAGAADFLMQQEQYELAKTFLYLSFERYQKAGLFDSIKILAAKVVKILKVLMEKYLIQKDVNSAKMTYDELLNIWESYGIKKDNIDPLLSKLITYFINLRDFSKVDSLIPKVEAFELQKSLTDLRMKEEEKIKAELKKDELEDITGAVKTLQRYISEETVFFNQSNKRLYAEAEKFVTGKDFMKAASMLKNQADWFKFIGQDQICFEIIEHKLDILIKAQLLTEFLHDVVLLNEEHRKNYLKRSLHVLENVLTQLMDKIKQTEFEDLITNLIKNYRHHLLYEESRIFGELLIQNLKAFAEHTASHKNEAAINQSIEIMRKIEQLCTAYLDGKAQDLDSTYKNLIEFYIEKHDLTNARAYNDKLRNKELAGKYNGEMERIESKKSGELAHKAKEVQEMRIFAEQLTQIKVQSRDQAMAQGNLLRMREGLKRRYFQEGIDKIISNDLKSTVNSYFQSTIDLIKTKKFELAGITTSVIGLISLILKNPALLHEKILLIDKELGLSKNLFHETYAMKILDYISQMIQSDQIALVKDALKLMDVVALFPEEHLLLDTLIGGVSIGERIKQFSQTITAKADAATSNVTNLVSKIEFDPTQFAKRQTFEAKFWLPCQNAFANQNYQEASDVYLSTVDDFITRKLEKIAIASFVMGFLSILKKKAPSEVHKDYDRVIFHLSKKYENFAQFPEIQLLEILLKNYDNVKDIHIRKQILDAFQLKMVLYDWERAYITNLLSQEQQTPQAAQTTKSEKSKDTGSVPINAEDDTLLTQQIIVISQQVANTQKDIQEMLKKRELGRRAYYQEMLDLLKTKKHLDATEKYLNLAKRMARRNDYELAGVMLLLTVLCQIAAKISVADIKTKLNETLNSLGLVEKILVDTLGIKLAHFSIDAISMNNDALKKNLKDLLQKMPFIDEEFKLIDF